ncbi:MAG: hypothetical protein ABIH04_03635 [Planctomycetota bacterium]
MRHRHKTTWSKQFLLTAGVVVLAFAGACGGEDSPEAELDSLRTENNSLKETLEALRAENIKLKAALGEWDNLLVVKQDPQKRWNLLREPAYQEMLEFSKTTAAVKAVYRELPVQPLPMLVVADNLRLSGPPIHGIDENLFREEYVEHMVSGFRYRPVEFYTDEGSLPFDDEESEDAPYVPVILPTIAGKLFDIFGSQDPSVEQFRRFVDISDEGKPGAPFFIMLKKKGSDGDPDSIRAYRCRVVGYSNLLPPPLTIAVPLRYAQEWNEFSGASPDYDRLILDVVDPEVARKHVQEAGFMTEANP